MTLPPSAEVRVQLHYAIQYAAATAAALVPQETDYGHTALEWHPALQAFSSKPVAVNSPEHPQVCVAMDPITLRSCITTPLGESLAEFPLVGKTLDDGFSWLQTELSALGANAAAIVPLSYPADDFPDHPIAHGAAFSDTPLELRQQLAQYYATSASLLQPIADTTPEASPVRIWPHHFDMATLLTFPAVGDGEPSYLGVGFSPGDGSYNQPYWYISPYPSPAVDALPTLVGSGHWHTQGWVGAVLTASSLDHSTNTAATSQLQDFITAAIAVSMDYLASRRS